MAVLQVFWLQNTVPWDILTVDSQAQHATITTYNHAISNEGITVFSITTQGMMLACSSQI